MKSSYTHFISKEEMENELVKVTDSNNIKKGGIPLSYNDDAIFLDESIGHSLVIGTTGSGKTQSISYPKIYTSILAGESMIIDDKNDEDYETFKDELKKNNYKVIRLDFYNYNGNKWNPLSLPYELFKKGEMDEALKLVEKVAYYLFEYTNEKNQDPFWITSSRSLFVGLTFAQFELAKGEVSIENVINSVNDLLDIITKVKKDVTISLLKNIEIMPKDTRGSVIAVFNHALLNYLKLSHLKDFLAKTDFDITDIFKEKVAIFVINSDERIYISSLFNLLIEEVLYLARKEKNKRLVNILLDDFDDYINFENFTKLLSDSRSNNLEFTILTRSLHRLSENYGDTNFENILSYFSRIIYLYANDQFTINYISTLCGLENADEPLVSETELKLLKTFDAIVLKSRMLPFKTKLLPYYQYKK